MLPRWWRETSFYWARQEADEVAFGGKHNPGFHVRIEIDGTSVTVLSVWAYRRNPSAQIPLDYLSAQTPYTRRTERRKVLTRLNRILPKEARIGGDKVDKRPTFSLQHLSEAQRLEDFKALIQGDSHVSARWALRQPSGYFGFQVLKSQAAVIVFFCGIRHAADGLHIEEGIGDGAGNWQKAHDEAGGDARADSRRQLARQAPADLAAKRARQHHFGVVMLNMLTAGRE